VSQASRAAGSRAGRGAAARRGLSLVECVVSIGILGTAAILYGSTYTAQVRHNEATREIENSTLLFLRQVERIRAQDPRAASAPFIEPDFAATRCPPFAYVDDGAGDLDPPVAHSTILTSANSLRIPDGHSWLVDPGPLTQQGYSLNVRAMRIRDSADPRILMEDRLIKYTIRIDRTFEGQTFNLVTGELIQEVR
jgi:hypothetical protein